MLEQRPRHVLAWEAKSSILLEDRDDHRVAESPRGVDAGAQRRRTSLHEAAPNDRGEQGAIAFSREPQIKPEGNSRRADDPSTDARGRVIGDPRCGVRREFWHLGPRDSLEGVEGLEGDRLRGVFETEKQQRGAERVRPQSTEP